MKILYKNIKYFLKIENYEWANWKANVKSLIRGKFRANVRGIRYYDCCKLFQ